MTTITFNDSLRLAQAAAEQAVLDAPYEQRPSLWAPRSAAQQARQADVNKTLRANVQHGHLYRWMLDDGSSLRGRPAGIEDFDGGIIAVDQPFGQSARRRTFRTDRLIAVVEVDEN